jgi:hypothetical protein
MSVLAFVGSLLFVFLPTWDDPAVFSALSQFVELFAGGDRSVDGDVDADQSHSAKYLGRFF